jgi:hypothetical protein
MSEAIAKYSPPKISKWDLEENGHRYVDPEPQTDWLGQEIKVGDIVVYSRTVGRSYGMSLAKVIGLYSRFTSKDKAPSNGVGLMVLDHSWRHKEGYLRKQNTSSDQLIKLLPEQYTEKISKVLLQA